MEKEPEPTYPQQYPQPYSYYYPYPPPKKDDKKPIIVLVVVVILAIVLPIILSFILYWMVIGVTPDHVEVPTGTWGSVTVISSTEVWVDFGPISTNPQPVDLEIILRRNGTHEGMYSFASNTDGSLSLSSGSNMGFLTYEDLADNRRVNVGDQLRISGLMPMSDYMITMVWGPTGDMLATRTFSTP